MLNTVQGPVRELNRYYWESLSVMYSVHDRYLTSCLYSKQDCVTVLDLLAPFASKCLRKNTKSEKFPLTVPLRFSSGTGGSAKPFSSRL